MQSFEGNCVADVAPSENEFDTPEKNKADLNSGGFTDKTLKEEA